MHDMQKEIIDVIFCILFIGVICFSIGREASWAGLDRETCFYLMIVFLGYISRNIIFETRLQFFISCFVIGFLYYEMKLLCGIYSFNIQNLKFPPHILYFLASMLFFYLSYSQKTDMGMYFNDVRLRDL